MANGNGSGIPAMPKLPGFAFGGGVMFSNTALLIGGAIAVATMWYLTQGMMEKKTIVKAAELEAKELNPATAENKIFSDVVAYATNAESIINNRDRIQTVIKSFRPRLREWREKYKRGEITREMYSTEINNIWRQIRDILKLPTVPTTPPHTPAPVNVPGGGLGLHLGQLIHTARPRPIVDTDGKQLGWTKGLHHGWTHALAKHKHDNKAAHGFGQ